MNKYLRKAYTLKKLKKNKQRYNSKICFCYFEHYNKSKDD